MTEMREFSLGAILSVTTDKLLTEMSDLYEILDWLTNDTLWTHQLPRAADACKPDILEQHPQLVEVDASEVTTDNWQEWLAKQEQTLGVKLTLCRLPLFAWQKRDAVEEMVEMAGEDKVTVLTPWPGAGDGGGGA